LLRRGGFRRILMRGDTACSQTACRLVVRLLDWNPWRHVFFRAIESVQFTT